MSSQKKTPDELRALTNSLIANPELISELSEEDVRELNKHVNPFGTIAPGKKSHIALSIIDIRETYLRQFLITSLIGYLYRLLEEYVPESVQRAEEEYNARINSTAVQEERDELAAERDKFVKRHTEAAKTVVRAFLNANFNFNPDKHIIAAPAAHKAPPESDPERPQQDDLKREFLSTAGAAPRADSAPPTPRDIMSAAGMVYQGARTASTNIERARRAIWEYASTVPNPQALGNAMDALGVLERCSSKVSSTAATLAPLVSADLARDTLPALSIEPPADVFHHFSRYMSANYEELRRVTNCLYCTKPDLETAVIYYDHFKTAEEARSYVLRHETEFKADVKVIENGSVTLLGPFRENRDRIDFYNKHTEVLKLIMKQIEEDHRIGEELMKKRIRRTKKKNLKEAGPDAPGLAAYAQARGVIAALGKKPELTRAEKEALVKSEQAVAEFETPDDALAIRVLAPDVADGLKQTFFYSEAQPLPNAADMGAGSSSSRPPGL